MFVVQPIDWLNIKYMNISLGDLIREIGRSLIDYSVSSDSAAEYSDQGAFLDVSNDQLDYYSDITRSNNENRPASEAYAGTYADVFDQIDDDDDDLSARRKKPKNPSTDEPSKKAKYVTTTSVRLQK